jgi:hypothetical protein
MSDQRTLRALREESAHSSKAVSFSLQLVSVVDQLGPCSAPKHDPKRQRCDTVTVNTPEFIIAVALIYRAAPPAGARQLSKQAGSGPLSNTYDPNVILHILNRREPPLTNTYQVNSFEQG